MKRPATRVVATVGTQRDRDLIRAAVDTVHRQVRSKPSSPVSYNAFDPRLQLWVAACLYRYYVDQHRSTRPPPTRCTATASGWGSPVREHLRGVASMAFLPWPVRATAGRFNLFATAGFLAPGFRAMMGLGWSASQQRRFDRLLAALPVGRSADPARDVDLRVPDLFVGHAFSCPTQWADRLGGVKR